ncbi:MAG TPA: DUF1003 domain-containing protein, partial [Capsulimonadaceae bacterium]|nr:DUF1003 domain-containing protein [Capsulimonadaceae bacterium]
VLITQNRQGKLDAQRDELDLQINLLTEQRTAKIVELLEELRRDLPSVPNRPDPVADALKETVDPHIVLTALEFQLERALDDSPDELLTHNEDQPAPPSDEGD